MTYEITDKRLKTPLRWIGGKSRAIKKMEKFNPDMDCIKEIRDPFLGGGSYPLYLAQKYPDKKIWVNDIYEPLYNFWCVLKNDSENLVKILTSKRLEYPYEERCKILFLQSKEILNDKNKSNLDRAVAFFIINKCSFSGLTEIGSFSKGSSMTNFNHSTIDNLLEYSKVIQNWKITNLDYTELLKDIDENVFVYLDPPYDIKSNVYGKKGKIHKIFNHLDLKETVLKFNDPHKSKLMISYNKDISGLTNNYFDLTYTMKSDKKYINEQKQRNEVLITNYFV